MDCRVCGKPNLSTVLDLGMQPWGNHFLKKEEIGREPFYPLHVVYCKDCQTAQLDYTVKKEVMFSDHTYLSGMTSSLKKHFDETARLANEVIDQTQKTKSVLDIGSNDGSQLQSYKNLGYRTLGVESSKRIAEIANENGIETVHAFFNETLAKELDAQFDLINASGVFFHLEELHSVTRGIKLCLKENGCFVVQFIYMKSILDNLAFDQIYHEHLLYYTLQTLQTLLKMHGLELFDAYLSPVHGGSIIAYAGHSKVRQPTKRLQELWKQEQLAKTNHIETYLNFARKTRQVKEKNQTFIEKKRGEGKVIYGMGAPVKGNTLLNFFGFGPDAIPYLIEKNHLRKNLFSPGMHIPILLEEEVSVQPDLYYVLAWNFKKEILKRHKHLIDQGIEFYFPVETEVH